FLACFATLALNGVNGEWRYLTPALPAAALLCAEVVVRVERRLRRRLAPADEPDSGDVVAAAQRQPAGASLTARVSAVASVAALGAIVVGTVAIHRPASLEDAPTAQVNSADFEDWPLTAEAGTLQCAGDDLQVWFTTAEGDRYALSGTAMAKSFF